MWQVQPLDTPKILFKSKGVEKKWQLFLQYRTIEQMCSDAHSITLIINTLLQFVSTTLEV